MTYATDFAWPMLAYLGCQYIHSCVCITPAPKCGPQEFRTMKIFCDKTYANVTCKFDSTQMKGE